MYKRKKRESLLTLLLLVVAMVIPVTGNAQVMLTYDSSISGNTNETADNLFDGNTSTKWCYSAPSTSKSAWVVFKASQACRLKGYTITTANDNASNTGRNPKDWIIYGSNDKSEWTKLDSVSDDSKLQDVNLTPFYFELVTPIKTAYEYYKWEITANQGANVFQVSEFAISAYCVDGSHDKLTFVEAKSPKCEEIGYSNSFYRCMVCDKCYSDAEGTNEIPLESVAIPAIGHDFVDGDGNCSVCGLSYLSAYAGTAKEPFKIANAKQLCMFRDWVNGTYTPSGEETAVLHKDACAILVADIDMSSVCHAADAEKGLGEVSWTPISDYAVNNGDDDKAWSGTFDGGGYSINNLYINSSSYYQGLFGYIKNSIVSNIVFNDVVVKSSGSCIGTLVGKTENSTFSHINVKGGTVEGNEDVGGLIGCSQYNKMSQSINSATVSGIQQNIGGLVGGTNDISLSCCANYADVYAPLAQNVGGLCGCFDVGTWVKATFNNSFSFGNVNGSGNVGLVIGKLTRKDVIKIFSYSGVVAYNTDAVFTIGGTVQEEKKDIGYANEAVSGSTGYTASQFASGEVTYALNASKSDGTQAWYQNLTAEKSDIYPILQATDGTTVYKVKKYSGCEHATGTVVDFYSNINTDVYEGYASGTCSHGSYQKAVYNSTDNVYEIFNASQFNWFAQLVNGTLTDGTTQNKAACAILMNDIDFGTDNFVAVGTTPSNLDSNSNSYAGTFDGNGHTIKVNQNDSTDVALFSYIGACTIKNLKVTGTINTGVKFAAGIAMHKALSGTAKIENCISDVTIESTVVGDGTHGGIIGVVDQGTLNINNCAFTGAINGSTTNSCGGFIGYTTSTSNISNSYVSATFGISSANCNIASRKGGTVTVKNCYYLNNLGNYIDGITKVTDAQMANGEVCYLLNQGTTDGTQAWYQNLTPETGDKYPVLKATEGNTVYGADISCVGVIVGNRCSNSPVSSEVYESHDMDAHGICSRGCFEPAVYNDAEGVYEIGNAGQYNWFAGLVNGTQAGTTQNRSAKAVLTQDIDFGPHNFLSIGGRTTTNIFEGTFDGRGHALTVNQSGSNNTTPFGYIGTCTIQNLTVKGVINTDMSFTSGFASAKYGSGSAYIKKCISDVVINSSVFGDGTHGGLLGTCEAGTVYIQDCGFTGAMNGENTTCCGGFIGYTRTTSNISGSYISATFGIEDTDCNIVSRKGGTVSASGCYYVNQIGTNVPSGMTLVTQAQVKSGELAYMLNGSKSDGTLTWYQDLTPETGDKHPVLTINGSNTVYYAAQLCGGIKNVGNTYANTETVRIEHVLGGEPSFNEAQSIYQKTCQREGCGTVCYFADSQGLLAAEKGENGTFTTDTYALQDATAYNNQAVFTATEFIYTRTFPTTNWSSWYVPFELTLTEEICSKYKFSRISNVHQYDTNNDGNADKTVVESFNQKPGVTLKANYPYLVKALTEEDKNMTITLTDVVAAKATENSIDCQSVDHKYTFTGTYSGMGDSGLADDSPYALFGDGQWWHFHSLSPMRHYLTISSLTPSYLAAPAMIVLQVTGDESATGIVNLYDDNRKKSETYDLSGRRLPDNSRQRGLIIQNGKVVQKK